jgi:hypothetical protein
MSKIIKFYVTCNDFLSEGMWLSFDLIINLILSDEKFLPNEAPTGIYSPADKRGVLSRTHRAHFAISYVAGHTDLLLLLL